MTYLSGSQRILVAALTGPAPVTEQSTSPAPAPTTRTALRRCRAAWRRAYDAYLRDECDDDIGSYDRACAAKKAANAYCAAMPLLIGYDGIRDFIACAAHGILIDAIPAERSSQLLYAAQVALTALRTNSHPPKALTPSHPDR